MSLIEKKCIPCTLGSQPLGHSQILELLVELNDDWFVEQDRMLKRTIAFRSFKEAFAFSSKIADLADFEGHHPELCIGWDYVIVHLNTHKIKGLSESDFILAAKIDALDL